MAALQLPLVWWKTEPQLSISCVLPVAHLNAVMVGCTTGEVYLLEETTLRIKTAFCSHRSRIVGLNMARQKLDLPRGLIDVVLSIDEMGELAMWTVSDGRCLLYNTKVLEGEPTVFSMLTGGDFCVVAGHASSLSILRVSTLEIIQAVPVEWVRTAVIVEDMLLVAFVAGGFVRFDVDGRSGRIRSQLRLETLGCLSSCAFLLRTEHGIVLADRQMCFEMTNDLKSVRCVVRGDCESIAAVQVCGGSVLISSAAKTQELCFLDGAVSRQASLVGREESLVAVSTDGRVLVLWIEADDRVRLTRWDTALSGSQPHAVQISPQGKVPKSDMTCAALLGLRLLSGHADGGVCVLENIAGAFFSSSSRCRLYAHRAPVCSLAVVCDGSRLVSGDWEGRVCVWDLKTDEMVQRLVVCCCRVCAIVTDIGEYVLVVAEDGAIVFLGAADFSVYARVCS